jgi:hypothetical protein
MNLIVFSNNITIPDKNIEEFILEIEIEHLFSRIIRIAKENNIKSVYCIIDRSETLLNKYISEQHDLGIVVNVIIKTKQSMLHELFSLSPDLKSSPFCMVSFNSLFSADDFSKFINYSLFKDDIEGIISLTHLKDEKAPLCVALNEEDRIIKFSNTTEGYNWIIKDICFFYPHFFDEMQYALQTGISGLQNYLQLLISKGYQLNGFIFSSILETKDLSFPNISDYFYN